MAYFYGWTHDQIEQLDVENFENYWGAIPIIEAQQLMKNLTASDWPHLKENSRESLHRQLYEQAYPDSFKETKQLATSDLARILGG